MSTIKKALQVATAFHVKVYPVTYEKFKTKYELQMVLPPGVVASALRTGLEQSHACRSTLVKQFVSGVRQVHPEAGKFKLELHQFDVLTFGEPRRATLRQHIQYFVLGLLNYSGALLVTETR